MNHLSVEGVLDAVVEIDLCMRCRAFWFDPYEDLHLTPASTLKIFGMIADRSSSGPFPRDSYCPRCGTKLRLAHDRQRNTPFTYWRCEREHGRFTPFIDFLREKDYIRPLSAEQVTELRKNVREVNCSNCGAPIDLTHDSVCAHCGSPLSMLDVKKVAELVAPSSPAPPAHDVTQIATLFLTHKPETPHFSLVDAGLHAVADWLGL